MKTVKPHRARKVHIRIEDGPGTVCGNWDVGYHDHAGNLPVPEGEMCSVCLRRYDGYEQDSD